MLKHPYLRLLFTLTMCGVGLAQESTRTPDLPVLKLDDAVAAAIQGNRQVQISALEVATAGQSTAEIRASRWPQFSSYIFGGIPLRPIDFTIPEGALGVYPSTGPIPPANDPVHNPQRIAAFIYASAAQPLSQLYKIGLAIDESKLGEQMAGERLHQTQQQASHQIKETYYQIAQTQSQIHGEETMLKYMTELEALTDRNLAEQTALKADSLNVKAKVIQQRYHLLTLRDTLETQKETLNQLLGRDLRTGFTVEVQPLPSGSEVDLEAAQKEALEHRHEIREAHLQDRIAELDVRRERAEYLPDVSLQMTYITLGNVNFVAHNILAAGVLVQWKPFDWGQKKHKTAGLRNTSREARLTVENAEQQVLVDVNMKFRRLTEARFLLETQSAVQEAERETLRVVMKRYEERSVLLADLLRQQSSLEQADTQYQQALAGLWAAKASFEQAIGRD